MGSTIQLHTETGEAFAAYLATPRQQDGAAAVVVLQEIFGVNANIRTVADWLADAGYLAIAPDLFWRQEPGVELDASSAEDRDRATSLMKGLDQDRAVEDALVAAAYVRTLPGASGRVGTVGYCLGGRLAYLLAMRDGIDAAVSYYGVAIQSALDKASQLQCRILLHIAGDDHLCPPEAQAQIREAFAPLGERAIVLDYPGVGHAFARHGGSARDDASADRADRATLDFLATELAR